MALQLPLGKIYLVLIGMLAVVVAVETLMLPPQVQAATVAAVQVALILLMELLEQQILAVAAVVADCGPQVLVATAALEL
jgi:membrane protein implicated in regulation of membrane protease activity